MRIDYLTARLLAKLAKTKGYDTLGFLAYGKRPKSSKACRTASSSWPEQGSNGKRGLPTATPIIFRAAFSGTGLLVTNIALQTGKIRVCNCFALNTSPRL